MSWPAMTDRGRSSALEIQRIGSIARRALRDGATGQVRAVFERSFYAAIARQWLCFGPPSLGAGPLNAECAPFNESAGASGLSSSVANLSRHDGDKPTAHRLSSLHRLATPLSSCPGLTRASIGRTNLHGVRGDASWIAGSSPAMTRRGDASAEKAASPEQFEPASALPALTGQPWIQVPTVGDPVRVIGDQVQIGQGLRLCFARAEEWKPPTPDAWNVAMLSAGIDALDRLTQSMVPSDGLAVLGLRGTAHRDRLSPVANAAEAPARYLGEVVRKAVASGGEARPISAPMLMPLLGLGPGLTPSGDDLLGGAMVALHLLGLDRLRDAIWTVLKPSAAEATNDISLAHLAAAAEGCGSAALHQALDSILHGRTDALGADIAAIDAIGHTSGWDALAGALIVLRAWLDTALSGSETAATA